MMLICICGRIGSGKTTVGLQIKEKLSAVMFSADEWMVHLYGEHLTPEEHTVCLEKCKSLIYNLTRQLLEMGLTVVLDFGFWARSERDGIRRLFQGEKIRFFYLPISQEEQEQRVMRRNNDSRRTYFFTEKMLGELNVRFEAPGDDESDVITQIGMLE